MTHPRWRTLVLAVLAPLLVVGLPLMPASAGISSSSSTFSSGFRSDTSDDALRSFTDFFGFTEISNATLAGDVALDECRGGGDDDVLANGNAGHGCVVASGQTVHSYLIHGDAGVYDPPTYTQFLSGCPDANTRSTNGGGPYFCLVSGSVTFDEPVLGIATSQANLDGSDRIARLTTATNESSRGLELPDFDPVNVGERVEIVNAYRIDFTLSLGNQLDQFRVLTEANDPPRVNAADLTVDEGQHPVPSTGGAFFDPDPMDSVRLVQTPTGSGSFSYPLSQHSGNWSFTPSSATVADDLVRTYRVTATDRAGLSDVADWTLTVRNVAPSIVQQPAATRGEGETVSSSITFADPGADTWSASVDFGDGSPVQTLPAVGKSFDISHVYPDDNPSGTSQDTYTTTVTVRDDDGGVDTMSFPVTIVNAVPLFDLGAPVSLQEDDTLSRTIGFTDAGGADVHSVVVNYGEGPDVGAPVTRTGPNGWSFPLSHRYLDDDPTGTARDQYVVTARVCDDDLGCTVRTLSVGVDDVAPDFTLPPVTVDENDLLDLPGVPYSDKGRYDTHTASVDYADGAGAEALTLAAGPPGSGAGSFDLWHRYLDDDPTATGSDLYLVEVVVRDDDTLATTRTLPLTVRNVAPTLELGEGARLSEDDVLVRTGIAYSDVGTLDTHTATVDYGDGTGLQPLALDEATRTFALSHRYLDDDPTGTAADDYTVTVTVHDDDGGAATDTFVVTVADLAPTTEVGDSVTLLEGDTLRRSGLSYGDVGTRDTHTATVDYGEGGPQPLHLDEATKTYALEHLYADDDPTATAQDDYLVTVVVTDDDGLSTTDSFVVTVKDVAPDLSISEPSYDGQLFSAPATVELTAPFTDPGTRDTFRCSIDWDEAAATDSPPGPPTVLDPATFSGTAGSCDATNVYDVAGVYTIRVTVTDDDGLFDVAERLVVVYDPSAGFVTGGGFIESPPGAYVPDPSVAGPARFGFVSRYQRGAKVPTGQTEFQFNAGGLNFHSDSYEWLVVSGSSSRAQYKGTGTVNGIAGYGFLLTAYDHGTAQGVDKLRMKITDAATGDVVYDNRLGESDDLDAADPQLLSQGQITIHTGKG